MQTVFLTVNKQEPSSQGGHPDDLTRQWVSLQGPSQPQMPGKFSHSPSPKTPCILLTCKPQLLDPVTRAVVHGLWSSMLTHKGHTPQLMIQHQDHEKKVLRKLVITAAYPNNLIKAATW